MLEILSIIWLLSTKFWNIKILGLILHDEYSGMFKLLSNPDFLKTLCATIFALFLVYFFRYCMFIIMLLSSFHFIRPNIIFKIIQVFKPLIPVDFFSFIVTDSSKNYHTTQSQSNKYPLPQPHHQCFFWIFVMQFTGDNMIRSFFSYARINFHIPNSMSRNLFPLVLISD